MKASRPNKVITNPVAEPQVQGVMGVLVRQANNILTGLLVIAAIFMLVRWRMNVAAAAKQQVYADLMKAQEDVSELRSVTTNSRAEPSELIKRVNLLQNGANGQISSVLNSGDADPRMRAQAFIARGDLYWYLANMPSLPGSATQPSLALNESGAGMLQKAWDAYQEVVKNSTYSDQHESLAAAHLGLAAIAENRGGPEWANAKKEFQAVIDDSKAPKGLIAIANQQMKEIPDVQEKVYVAPPATNPIEALLQSMESLTPPPQAPAPTSMPTTMPGGMPKVLPTTLPMVPVAIPAPVTGHSVLVPSTMPAMPVTPLTKPAGK